MSLSTENLQALLILNHAGGGISLTLMEALCHLPASVLLERILEQDLFGKSETIKACLKEFNPARELEACEKSEFKILTYWDADYPESLRSIVHPPALLYVAGRILNDDTAAAAIVGSRYPTLYGIAQTRKFAARLAESGLTIVSGLAQGIDLAAHEGALTVSYGRTLAVLGCGLEVDYPRHRKKFQQRISERGAVISEYSLTMPPLPENFPKRNRLISGLSLGVLVMEAHQKSGSLITAQLALDQGREVFAMPGPVDGLTSRGTNQLIKQGAYLAESAEDILEILKPALERLTDKPQAPAVKEFMTEKLPPAGKEPKREVSEAGMAVLETLKTHGPLAWEELLEALSEEPRQVLPLVTELELKRVIKKRGDGRFEVLL